MSLGINTDNHFLLLFCAFSLCLEYLINSNIHIDEKITLTRMLQIFLIVPVLEELVFRGVFQDRIRKRYGWKTGIFVSSFLFMLIHFGSLDQMILSLIFSCLSGYLYYKSSSLLLSVVFHVLINVGICVIGAF